MKRDMDLVRDLLLRLEEINLRPGAMCILSPHDEEMRFEGFTEAQVEYHMGLIREAGLIEYIDAQPMSGIAFRRLSWSGHDFLDTVRDPHIWAETKKGVSRAGGFTMELLRDLAKGFLKKQIAQHTGIEL